MIIIIIIVHLKKNFSHILASSLTLKIGNAIMYVIRNINQTVIMSFKHNKKQIRSIISHIM